MTPRGALRRHNSSMDITDLPETPGRPKGPRKTALHKLQGDLQQLKPFGQIHEMQNLVRRYSPEYQVHEVLDRTSISRKMQEMLDSTSIASQAQKLMEQYFPKTPLGLSDEVSRLVAGKDVFSEAFKQYEQYLKPLSQQQELLKKLQSQTIGGLSVRELTRRIEQANPALAAIATAKKSLDNLEGAFRDLDFRQFDGDNEDEQETKKAAQSITKSVTSESDPQEFVNQIIAAIRAQQKPTVQLMLWLFFGKLLDWIISGFIGAVISQHMTPATPQSPQQATKEVKEVARAAVGSPELLVDYRFVSAKVLIVRQNPKARSPQIGRLTFSKPVKLLKKDKDFALVVWTDKESGTEVQGWVFSRYLEKFN